MSRTEIVRLSNTYTTIERPLTALEFLVEHLKALGGYHYLASPYSKYAAGPEIAWSHACEAAAILMNMGLPVFCPIAMTHPIATDVACTIDPLDFTKWIPLDRPLMEGASSLIVVKMPGWNESSGIKAEIEYFVGAGKPVMFMNWPVEG